MFAGVKFVRRELGFAENFKVMFAATIQIIAVVLNRSLMIFKNL